MAILVLMLRRRVLLRCSAVVVAACLLLVVAEIWPAATFPYAVKYGTLQVHSLAPLPAAAAEVFAEAEKRLQRSPLYDAAHPTDVFVCDGGWRWLLYTGLNRRAAAVARIPWPADVIVRGVDFPRDLYLQASGDFAPPDRPASGMVAHELTHVLVARRLSWVQSWRLPAWVREGYADYVGRGPDFDHEDARAAFVGHAKSATQSGQYLEYTLFISHVLDHWGWPLERLLTAPPPRSEVEAALR
jgi:hypothetical protein